MNNLLSYCGLVDAKIRASDKDLPVLGRLLKICATLFVLSFKELILQLPNITILKGLEVCCVLVADCLSHSTFLDV
jgi:hypothetical protein